MSDLTTTVLAEIDSATLTGTFQDFGSALAGPAYDVQFVNASTVESYFTDGTSNWRIPKGVISLSMIEKRTNGESGKYILPKGAQLQIKEVTTAGTGSIWAHIVTER